jgi:hypothetical protein
VQIKTPKIIDSSNPATRRITEKGTPSFSGKFNARPQDCSNQFTDLEKRGTI